MPCFAQAEVAAQHDQVESSAGSNMDNAALQADVPSPASDPSTSTIAGLTPVNVATPCYTAATPVTMGPSPVMPIKLDSLWSPEMPPSICPQLETSAPSIAQDRTTDGVDLAAMFISTPAPSTAADAGTSPVGGLVSAEASADPLVNSSEPFSEEPFGGFAETAMDHSTAEAVQQTQMSAESQQQQEAVGFGSPAAVTDPAVAEVDATEPLVPMSLSHHPTPVPSSPAAARTRGTPAAANITPGRSGRTPGRACKSPAPTGTPASPYPDSDDDMPEAESEYPEEKAILAEALAETLTLQPQQAEADAVNPLVQQLKTAEAVLQASDNALEQSQIRYEALEPEQLNEEPDLMEGAEIPAAMEESADVPLTEKQQPGAELDAAEETENVVQEEVTSAAAATPAAVITAGIDQQPTPQPAVSKCVEFDMQPTLEAESVAGDDSMMNVADHSSSVPVAAPTPDKAVASGDVDDDAVMSPDFVSLTFDSSVTAGRHTGSRSTPAAMPKSAMAKPKSAVGVAGKETERKSAHVVLPGPSPVKSTAKPAAGRTNIAGGGGAASNDSSSPGHTPFPTKSKIRAATTAADRAAAAGKEVSLKKEIAYTRAHSALKQYSNKADQQADLKADGSSPGEAPPSANKSSGSGGKVVSSRLLQPTASSMAKHRSSLASDADPHVWPAPESEGSVAAVGSSRPRLASKVVVPSPPPKVEPSMKALKRAIKEKTEQKAKATVAENQSTADTHRVRAQIAVSSVYIGDHTSFLLQCVGQQLLQPSVSSQLDVSNLYTAHCFNEHSLWQCLPLCADL